MQEQTIDSLSLLNNDEYLIKFLGKIDIDLNETNKEKFTSVIKNKLLECFITSDGSITKMLKIILGENFNLNVLKNSKNEPFLFKRYQ